MVTVSFAEVKFQFSFSRTLLNKTHVQIASVITIKLVKIYSCKFFNQCSYHLDLLHAFSRLRYSCLRSFSLLLLTFLLFTLLLYYLCSRMVWRYYTISLELNLTPPPPTINPPAPYGGVDCARVPV
jgi:hypothetical protein